MNIKLDMPVGTYRELTEAEFKEMNALLDSSAKQMAEEKKTNDTNPTSRRKIKP